MPNLRQKINAHNKSFLHSTHDLPKSCNRREPVNCPLNGNCHQSSVIYQATVETNDNKPSQTYIGLTENPFKTRFTNHRNPFKDHKKKLCSELSKHVWKVKEGNVKFQISWKILKHAALLTRFPNDVTCACWRSISLSADLNSRPWTGVANLCHHVDTRGSISSATSYVDFLLRNIINSNLARERNPTMHKRVL